MIKAKASMKNNIVFVNSFKGGTGKTSISLSLCVSAALSNENLRQYSKIFYLDIDILGTGSSYKLFPQGIDDKKFFNDYEKKRWYEFSTEIGVETNGKKGLFNALCINPNLRIKKTNYENTTIKVNSTSEEIFIGGIVHYITESSKEEKDKPNLYILDCSPGFNKIERELILKLSNKQGYDVNEVFVTSYDSSHVEKTVECLKEYLSTMKSRKNRHIVLNDIHNLVNVKTDGYEKINLDFASAEKEIKKLFDKGEKKSKYKNLYNIYEIKYNENLCSSNLLTHKIGLERSSDDYNIIESSLYKKVVDYDSTQE